MAMGSFDPRRHQGPLAEINVVPLVDVMLVLLVIFIITAPLLTHSVKIDLPKASNAPNITKPEHIEFGIREGGALFWNGAPVTLEALGPRFAAEARAAAASNRPQPELHIRADRHAHYETVAQVMSAAAKSGLVRIGFVTDPSR
jgi:biopolymer transport protein ExbD